MNPIYNLLRPFAKIIGKFPKQVLAFRLQKDLGKKINTKNPVSLYDKIYWLSFNTDTTKWSLLADKYGVREHIKKEIGEAYLPKLYGVYESINDVDYTNLPKSFVIKTNNGCASNFLVRDKGNTDLEKIRKELAYWLKFPYGELTGQKHYTRIPPRIIAEEYLFQEDNPEATLIDYKFFCFDGKPHYCETISERVFGTHLHNKMIYDMNWESHPNFFKEGCPMKEVEKPQTFEKMKEIAQKLANGFKFVRVDLYEVNGKIKFGELTFTPTTHNFTEEFQDHLGSLIKL